MKRALVAILTLLPIAVFAQEKPFENVKVLTGLTQLQMQRQMNLIRAGLGVHCDYCHVVDDAKGWQFGREDKREKQEAREMIEMTIAINKEHFGGRPVVTCFTCHDGHPRPALTAPLPQAQPPFPTPVVDRSAFPAAKDLVAKYVTAIGGAAAADKIENATTRTLKGTRLFADGKTTSPVEVFESGDKVRVETTTPDGAPLTQTLDGEAGWVRNKDGVRPMRPSEMENIRTIANAFKPFVRSSVADNARVVAKEKIGDSDVWVVSTRREGAQTRLYFDAGSGFLRRRQVLYDGPIGRLPEQTDFDDYRDAGGVKVPFMIRTSFVDPWAGSTRKADEIVINAKVDESMFAPPQASHSER